MTIEEKRAAKRRWAKDNPDKVKAYAKAYAKENEEVLRAKRRQYREKNREELRAKERRYREENGAKLAEIRERNRKSMQAYRDANRDKIRAAERASHWRRKYGLTLEEYRALRADHPTCDICGTEDWGRRGPVVDHCHATDAVRGLLCIRCNLALGLCDDDIDRLRAAAAYLEHARESR